MVEAERKAEHVCIAGRISGHLLERLCDLSEQPFPRRNECFLIGLVLKPPISC